MFGGLLPSPGYHAIRERGLPPLIGHIQVRFLTHIVFLDVVGGVLVPHIRQNIFLTFWVGGDSLLI